MILLREWVCMDIDVLDRIVPISDFNRGKASTAFNRVANGQPVVVMKRNVPSFVIITTDDYRQAMEAEEDLRLLQLAADRMADFAPSATIGRNELMEKYGISESDLTDAPEVDFE